MNKTVLKASTIFLAAMTVFGTANAQEQSGKINFEGLISPVTCTLSTSDQNKRVSLGIVKPTEFVNIGDNKGSKPFTLVLEGCTAPTALNGHPPRASVRFRGDRINSNTSNLNLIGAGVAGSGAAAGVQVRLLNGNGTKINLAAADQAVTVYPLSQGSNTMNFSAEYTAVTLPVVAGHGNTVVDFEITYP